MIEKSSRVAIIIVGFRNPREVNDCLNALAQAEPIPQFDIYICENGGKEAFQELNGTLMGADGACDGESPDLPTDFASAKFAEIKCLTLKGRSTMVWTARATSNLGYAGAINSWISRLKTIADWTGLWILNPDTKPYPDALAKLMHRAVTGNKGMVSSTLVDDSARDFVHNRALRWNKFLATTTIIGTRDSVRAPCDSNKIEAVMDSPSGASMYVTRRCVEQVGPMDERFFLYFEDVDWGMRGKKYGLGYAQQSVVAHKGGTTFGKISPHRADSPELSVYLESRNRLLFAKKHFPYHLAFVSFMSVIYAFRFLSAGSTKNFKTALQGILAGWSGETGPPPNPRNSHLRAIFSNIPTAIIQKAKLAVSLLYYCGRVVWRGALRIVGRSLVPQLTILYYHGVENSYRFEFSRQMDVLLRATYVVPADFQGTLPSKKAHVAITFDDALESVAENALPELARRSFHSTIFVPAGFIGRMPHWIADDCSVTFAEAVMTSKAVKALSPTLVSIGSHGLFHERLSKVSRNQAKYEIEESRNELQRVLEREINLFAFPYGDYDECLVELCKSAGYKHVYSTDPRSLNANEFDFLRGRVRADLSDGKLQFFLKINGAYDWLAFVRSIVRRQHRPAPFKRSQE